MVVRILVCVIDFSEIVMDISETSSGQWRGWRISCRFCTFSRFPVTLTLSLTRNLCGWNQSETMRTVNERSTSIPLPVEKRCTKTICDIPPVRAIRSNPFRLSKFSWSKAAMVRYHVYKEPPLTNVMRTLNRLGWTSGRRAGRHGIRTNKGCIRQRTIFSASSMWALRCIAPGCHS